MPSLGLEYRRRFNAGEIVARGSIGYLRKGTALEEDGLGYHIFSRGRFAIDENWRAGFDFNRASSETYLRTFRYGLNRYRRTMNRYRRTMNRAHDCRLHDYRLNDKPPAR